jgi:photosystem II stability/assembly factor-like uncharacterized protein
MRRWPIGGALALVLCALGCHREVEMVPLADRTIYTTDRFYDVQAVSQDRAFVVGYAGKIVETTDGGRTWTGRPSGSDLALYSVHFVDDEVGWISGQDGLILHTANGGKTWDKQESNASFEEKDSGKQPLFLFSITALDRDHAWAVGDRSILTSTRDGGKTWTARKVGMETDLSGGQSLAAADPIFYDVKFLDQKRGWIVGEFGKIMHTSARARTSSICSIFRRCSVSTSSTRRTSSAPASKDTSRGPATVDNDGPTTRRTWSTRWWIRSSRSPSSPTAPHGHRARPAR